MRHWLIVLGMLGLLLGCELNPAEKRSPDALALEIAVSPSPDFIDEWVNTPSEHEVVIQRLSKARRAETVHVAFIASGHAANAEGLADLSVSFKLIRPDATEMFSEQDYAGYDRPKGNGYVMLDPALDITFDGSDPLGTYRIEGVLDDRVAKRSATASYELVLGE